MNYWPWNKNTGWGSPVSIEATRTTSALDAGQILQINKTTMIMYPSLSIVLSAKKIRKIANISAGIRKDPKSRNGELMNPAIPQFFSRFFKEKWGSLTKSI